MNVKLRPCRVMRTLTFLLTTILMLACTGANAMNSVSQSNQMLGNRIPVENFCVAQTSTTETSDKEEEEEEEPDCD